MTAAARSGVFTRPDLLLPDAPGPGEPQWGGSPVAPDGRPLPPHRPLGAFSFIRHPDLLQFARQRDYETPPCRRPFTGNTHRAFAKSCAWFAMEARRRNRQNPFRREQSRFEFNEVPLVKGDFGPQAPRSESRNWQALSEALVERFLKSPYGFSRIKCRSRSTALGLRPLETRPGVDM